MEGDTFKLGRYFESNSLSEHALQTGCINYELVSLSNQSPGESSSPQTANGWRAGEPL